MTAFQTFEAPLVELPRVDDSDSEAIGRVCAIFEKLNSTGVDLSVYDLLTARLYRSGIRLHDLWAEACQRPSALAGVVEGQGRRAQVRRAGACARSRFFAGSIRSRAS